MCGEIGTSPWQHSNDGHSAITDCVAQAAIQIAMSPPGGGDRFPDWVPTWSDAVLSQISEAGMASRHQQNRTITNVVSLTLKTRCASHRHFAVEYTAYVPERSLILLTCATVAGRQYYLASIIARIVTAQPNINSSHFQLSHVYIGHADIDWNHSGERSRGLKAWSFRAMSETAVGATGNHTERRHAISHSWLRGWR